jgi:hypothetical protein
LAVELKQALAVSLIAVVAASLVLLLARALDLQTATRLEPQLAQIAEELQTVRQLLAKGRTVLTDAAPRLAEPSASSTSQAGLSAGWGSSGGGAGSQETLVVWYFHGTMRCPTCQTIEALAHEVVQTDFAQELASGRVVWKTANYEKPFYSALAQKMQVRMPVVALARMAGDQLLESKTLEEVWGLVQDKTNFRDFLQKQIRQMLQRSGREPVASGSSRPSSIRTEPSAASEEPTLATRPNLLRLNPPDPAGEKSSDAAAPEIPSKMTPKPEAKDLPLPE